MADKRYAECPTLLEDIERFLAEGGEIEQCPPLTFKLNYDSKNIFEACKRAWDRKKAETIQQKG